jgi:hypothetical protein
LSLENYVAMVKEKIVARKNIVRLGILAAVLAFGLVVAACATTSSIGGTADSHGLISKAKLAVGDNEPIATYGIILGLVDSGYQEYVAIVKEAEAAGKAIRSVTTSYFGFYIKVAAYAE